VNFFPTVLPGVFVVEPQKLVDERGFFARTWCRESFESRGLNPVVAQANIGFSPRRGTLRGLHFQVEPYAEAKLVRCSRGVVHDVAVDLRPESETFLGWVGLTLSADTHRMLYVPEGCAHGYLTLTDDAEVSYQTSQPYVPEAASGRRYDDPALGIEWPIAVEVISEQDRSWPLLSSVEVAA
jgi:dTDP-4-dehydrorhamnose 3,5-epimerase